MNTRPIVGYNPFGYGGGEFAMPFCAQAPSATYLALTAALAKAQSDLAAIQGAMSAAAIIATDATARLAAATLGP